MIRTVSLFRGVGLLIISLSLLQAQSLEDVWQDFQAVSNQISQELYRQDHFLSQQQDLLTLQETLKNEMTWYNSWLNKWRLAASTEEQLALADSLRISSVRLGELNVRQNEVLTRLKTAYRDFLEAYTSRTDVLDQNTLTIQDVTRFLISSPSSQVSLPDYAPLIENEFESKSVRDLVYQDVKRLLDRKIRELDAVIEQRRNEYELSARMEAFQEDLGLQLQAGVDIQERDQGGDPSKSYSWDSFQANPSEAADLGPADMRMTGSSDLLLNNPSNPVQTGSVLNTTPQDTLFLKEKKAEYVRLLLHINQALNSSP